MLSSVLMYNNENGLAWIVLAVSVGYLLFRFVLAAPTWTMTAFTQKIAPVQCNWTILPIMATATMAEPVPYIGIPLLTDVAAILGIRYSAYFIKYRLYPHLQYLWQTAKLDPARAVQYRLEGIWITWLSYTRCQVYFCINLVCSLLFSPKYCFYVFPSIFFLIGGTLGYYITWYTPKSIRSPWLYGFPAVFLIMAIALNFDLIHYSMLIDPTYLPSKVLGFSVVYCALDDATPTSTPTVDKQSILPTKSIHQTGIVGKIGQTLISCIGADSLRSDLAGKMGVSGQVIATLVATGAGLYAIRRYMPPIPELRRTGRVALYGPKPACSKLVEHPVGSGIFHKHIEPGDMPLFGVKQQTPVIDPTKLAHAPPSLILNDIPGPWAESQHVYARQNHGQTLAGTVKSILGGVIVLGGVKELMDLYKVQDGPDPLKSIIAERGKPDDAATKMLKPSRKDRLILISNATT